MIPDDKNETLDHITHGVSLQIENSEAMKEILNYAESQTSLNRLTQLIRSVIQSATEETAWRLRYHLPIVHNAPGFGHTFTGDAIEAVSINERADLLFPFSVTIKDFPAQGNRTSLLTSSKDVFDLFRAVFVSMPLKSLYRFHIVLDQRDVSNLEPDRIDAYLWAEYPGRFNGILRNEVTVSFPFEFSTTPTETPNPFRPIIRPL